MWLITDMWALEDININKNSSLEIITFPTTAHPLILLGMKNNGKVNTFLTFLSMLLFLAYTKIT